jgi:REP element-mobilizing transposase RayT
MDLVSFGHGYGQCVFHIVLVSKYGRELFVPLEIKSCCEIALRETAFKAGCEVFVLQVGDDYVYIFVGLHPSCFCF